MMISVLRLLIGVLLSFLFLLSPLLAVTPDELPESFPESSHSSHSPYNEKSEPISKISDLQAFWPLQEGHGNLVHDINGRHHGLLRTLQDGVAPTWGYKNGEPALLFSGGKFGGRVEVHRGGAILYGTRFRISLDIAPLDRNSLGMLVTCKHATSTGGGFSLFYWGAQKKLIFSFADGKGIHKFETILHEKFEQGIWSSIEITYNGIELSIRIANKAVGTHYDPGLRLQKSTAPFLIGGYYNSLGIGFNGWIRNVVLSIPSVQKTLTYQNKALPLGDSIKKGIIKITKVYKSVIESVEGPELKAHDKYFIVANNMVVPNWFMLGSSAGKAMKLNATYYLDVPDGIKLVHIGTGDELCERKDIACFKYRKVNTVQHDGKQFKRFEIRISNVHPWKRYFGPVYLRSWLPDGTNSRLYYSAAWDTGRQDLQKIEVLTRTFSSPGPPLKLHTSIGWMFTPYGISWPDFFETYGKLGFNAVAIHGLYDSVLADKRNEYVKQARSHGFNILYVDSAFHPLKNKSGTDSVVPDKMRTKDICPAYRGKHYYGEISRIAELVRLLKPDYAFWDIECFKDGANTGITGLCRRCNDYIAASGKVPREAIIQLGTSCARDIRQSFVMETKYPIPVIGVYHTKPRFVYQDIFDFNSMYGKGVDVCMPVFYDSRKRKWMGDELRDIRRQMPRGDIIPWLQPGTIKDYPSPWIYDGVLESFGSGARGITWYAFRDMEGEDLFYFAKAMESIIQVEDIIYNSEPVEGVVSKNKKVNVTAIRKGNEYLFLLSGYSRKPFAGEVTIILPQHITGTVWDLARKEEGGKIIKDKVIINFEPGVQGGHTALYYIGEHTF